MKEAIIAFLIFFYVIMVSVSCYMAYMVLSDIERHQFMEAEEKITYLTEALKKRDDLITKYNLRRLR